MLICSSYQHPLYPGSGAVPMGTNMVNVPVPPYTRGMAVRELIDVMWMPRLEEFAPQMLFISAGFDAHREDDMAQLGLVHVYVSITSLDNRLSAILEPRAAAPHTPLPNGMRTQAICPWNGPSTSSCPSKR